MSSVYVCIGNSDDKLSQEGWSSFFTHVRQLIDQYSDQVYGVWCSLPAEPWQNACFGFSVSDPDMREYIRTRLAHLAWEYRQDWISWTEAETEIVESREQP